MKKYILCFLLVLITCYTSGQNTYVYTKFGKTVNVFSLSDVGFDAAYANSYAIQNFPQATFLSTSTRTYNCHFYAWHIADGGSGYYWMNSEGNNNNISKYWTDDYYAQTSDTSAPKIFYYDSDHSAIASSVSGMYESKWGEGPRMRHAPGYGPYSNMSNRRYYKKTYFNGLLNPNGYGETQIGVSSYYSAPYLGNNITGIWDVTDAKGEYDGFTENPSGSTNTITFSKHGLFELNYHIYLISTGESVGTQAYQVIVSP